MAKNSMWTISMTRCQTCPLKSNCPDREKTVTALSNLTHQMNMDKTTEGGATGTIIVACGQ